MRSPTITWLAVVTCFGLTGCQATPTVSSPPRPIGSEVAAAASPRAAAPVSSTRPAARADPSTRSRAGATSPAKKPLAGRVIVIDPGHNGGWTRRELRLVPDGNGRSKPCNSSGTATRRGYAEHAYNWAQAKALADALRARGARVELTRENDHGRGPCVNLRATLANKLKADALISIHADGNAAKRARGFHVIHSPAMAGGRSAQADSTTLAKKLRQALESGTSMPRSTYIGGGTALSKRGDLGTLNFSKRPAVMLEMGNMFHAADAALLTSPAARTKAAKAIADALAAYFA